MEYYFSSSSGDDGHDGAAPSWDGTHGPWKTLAKAGAATFSAGDRILLKCGDEWNEQLTVNSHGNRASCGMPENPIEISSYGVGDKPKILRDMPTDMNKAQFCIQIFEASGWKITNLEIGRSTYGIDFHYSTQGNSHIFVDSCHFRDVAHRNMAGPPWMNEYGFSSAVQISGERRIDLGSPYVSDVTVQNCTSQNSKSLFYNGTANLEFLAHTVKNVALRNNRTYGGTWGWCLHCVDGGIVENCVSLNAGLEYFEIGAAGAVVFGCRDVDITNCEFGYTKFVGTDGVGFDFEGRNSNVRLMNCEIHDNEDNGILTYANNGSNYNCAVYNCRMLRDCYGTGEGHTGFTLAGGRADLFRNDDGMLIAYLCSDKNPDSWLFPDKYNLENNYSNGTDPPPLATEGYPKSYSHCHEYVVYSGSRNGAAGIDSTGTDFARVGQARQTERDGAWAQFTFLGTGIEFSAPKSDDQGDVDIYVDGGFCATASTYASDYAPLQAVFSKTDLPVGPHNIKIAKKSGGYMRIGEFKVYRNSSK